MTSALTIYQGRSADRTPFALPGARVLGDLLAQDIGQVPTTIGTGAHVPATQWQGELRDARADLVGLGDDIDRRLRRGHRPLTVLTRCAAAVATLPIVARHRPDACVVWFDAHADLNTPQSSPSGYLGGMVLAAATGLWDSGLGGGLSVPQIVLVGVRDVDRPEQHLIDTGGLRLVTAKDAGGAALRRAIAGRPVYVHLDVDVLDAGLLPTDFSVPGGLQWADLHRACEVIADHDVVGLEIAELEWRGSPIEDEGRAQLVAALAPLLRLWR